MKLRRNERGVALSEAVISLPVLIVLLGASFQIHRAHGAKAAVENQSRLAAWQGKDLGTCAAPGSPGEHRVDENAVALGDEPAQYVTDAAFYTLSGATSQGQGQGSYTGDGSRSVQSTHSVTCGERGDALDGGEQVIGLEGHHLWGMALGLSP